jgi:hypothetical protein
MDNLQWLTKEQHQNESGPHAEPPAQARKDASVTDMLRQELENIANAKRGNFEDAEDFRAWAQNRARFTLDRATKAILDRKATPAQAASAPQDVAADLREALWAILYNDQENLIDPELFEQAKDAVDAYDRAKLAPVRAEAPQGVNAQLLAAAREAYAAFCFGWRNRNEMGELEAFKQAIAAAEASAPVEAIPRERVRETLTRLRSDWQEELGSYGDDQPGFGTPDEYFEIRGQLHALEVVAAALGIEQEKKGEK